ncbi:MAG: hypothetical protein LUD81_10325, partial [Clostridiales bacterium]|nr:hypothetical protein [Clostridiales bacterium]
LWGFMFSVLFSGISAFLTFTHGAVITAPSIFVRILLVFLSCYTAMIVSKPWERWYYVLGLMILLVVLTGLIGMPAYISGDLAASVVYALISLVLFVFCAFNIGK